MKLINETKVFVNGTFDVLHAGHLALLNYAKSLGDYLIVGIDTDERVKQFKGELRPINCIKDRIDFMNSIKYVNSSVSFSTDKELCDRIKEWNTDIIVVGNDYKDKKVIGSHLVKEVIFFEKIDGYSSTKIIESK